MAIVAHPGDGFFAMGLPIALEVQRGGRGEFLSLPAHSTAKLFFANNWEDAEGFMPDTYLDVTPVFDGWFDVCATFPMWRGETGFRYNDYYQARAIDSGCVSGSKYATALMSPPEQLVQHVREL